MHTGLSNFSSHNLSFSKIKSFEQKFSKIYDTDNLRFPKVTEKCQWVMEDIHTFVPRVFLQHSNRSQLRKLKILSLSSSSATLIYIVAFLPTVLLAFRLVASYSVSHLLSIYFPLYISCSFKCWSPRGFLLCVRWDCWAWLSLSIYSPGKRCCIQKSEGIQLYFSNDFVQLYNFDCWALRSNLRDIVSSGSLELSASFT